MAAVRLYAQESAAAMVPAGFITAFWFSGTKLARDWNLMPGAMLGAALGTFIGVNLGLGGVL